ncbi:hypothetical protein ACH5RR_036445 [Cinchona calisaya]|uniref:Uncharacterized protein n=1 Tax=Cinchona calisaya TaxID=153742 RepID=A0ABD2Y381_9GENT
MASSSNTQDPLDNQEGLEDDSNSGPCISDKIHRITIMINILRPFLSCTLNWHIEDRNVEVKLKHIDDAVQIVIQDYQLLNSSNLNHVSGNEDWRSSSRNQELVLSNLMKLKLIKSDMKEIYTILAVFVSMASKVVSFIDSLLENLKDILSYKVDIITPVVEQIEALEDRLRFSRNFLWFIAKHCIKQKKMKDLLIYAEFVAVNVAYLLYLCLVDDKMHETMIREMRTKLVDLVKKLNPVKAETKEIYLETLKTLRSSHIDTPEMGEQYLAFVDSLIDNLRMLSNNEAISFPAKDQMEKLLDELRLLRFNLMDPPFDAYSKKVRTLIVHIKTVINKTGYFFYLFHVNEMNEEMVGQLKLEQLQHAETLRFPFKHQAEIVYEELDYLRKDFSEIAEELNQNEELKVLLEHFKDTAYHAELIVDSLVAQTGSFCCHKLGLFDVTKEIRLVKRELKAIRKQRSSDTPAPVLLQANFPNIKVVPGSENEERPTTEEATIKLDDLEKEQLGKMLDEDPSLMERREAIAKRLEVYKSARDEIDSVAWK